MNLRPLRAAVALTAALTTAATPLLAAAQTSYEFKALKRGLVVDGPGSGQTPGPGGGGTPPASQPALQLSTSTINFGDVATNTTETRQVLVSNPGTGSLSFTAAPAVTGDAAFAAGLTTCGSSLAAGADCLSEVTFSPTSTGSFNGMLTLTTALAGSPHEVFLAGTAFNPVSLASTALPKALLGVPYTYDFKQLLGISNEASPDKGQAAWEGNGPLPSGLSFNTGTGVLSGTPSALTAGASYTVIGTYKSNQGQQVYTIKVGEAVLDVVRVAVGGSHTCAVTTAGGLKCWGYDAQGQLGNDAALTQQPTPVDVLNMTSGIASVSAGNNHTCAVTIAGGLKCWGYDGSGQLGNDTALTNKPTPVDVLGLTSGVASVAAGGNHTCAVTIAGGLKCWGDDNYGQLGNDAARTNQPTPVNILGWTAEVANVSAGHKHTCAVTTAGELKCWGNDSSGQVGDGWETPREQPIPANVVGLTTAVASVSTGADHTCAVTTSGGLKCWGNDANGQLGNDPTLANKPTPVDVLNMTSGVASVSSGGNHTCAVTTAGGLKCWGRDNYGQLGNDAALARQPTPVAIPSLTGVASVSAGYEHTCAVTNEGGLKCWGRDSYGQLGNDASFADQPIPVNVSP